MVSLTTPLCDFGWSAPDFTLPGIDGKPHSLSSCRGPRGLLVMFICNHCPYVKAVLPRIAAPLALATVATMSGDLPPSVERQNQIDNLQRRITTREAAGKTGTSRGTPGDFTGWNTTDDLKKQLAALQGGSGSEVQAQADAIGVAVAKHLEGKTLRTQSITPPAPPAGQEQPR